MNRLLVASAVLFAVAPQSAQARVRTVEAVVTAYCPCQECCGPNARGITSTGQDARLSGCAVDPRHIPYGSRVHVPGIGWRTADDTGSAMREHGDKGIIHVDVRMRSHAEALRFGIKHIAIRVEDART
jgi:3D (Asp-Asp-Asp) domain-containing protein